jgi:hydrogenase maturation factor
MDSVPPHVARYKAATEALVDCTGLKFRFIGGVIEMWMNGRWRYAQAPSQMRRDAAAHRDVGEVGLADAEEEMAAACEAVIAYEREVRGG